MVCTHGPYLYRSSGNELLVSRCVLEVRDWRGGCVTSPEEFFDEHSCDPSRGVPRILVITVINAQHVEELLNCLRRGRCHSAQLGFSQDPHGLVTQAWEN